jgi:hypothetical protein
MNERDRELAREAGIKMFHEDTLALGYLDNAHRKFAELVRADEREACAKLVDPSGAHRRNASWGYLGGEEGVELLDGKAAAIRARSNK